MYLADADLTETEVRTRVLMDVGLTSHEAAQYIRLHPRPTTSIEQIALLHAAGSRMILAIGLGVFDLVLRVRRTLLRLFGGKS